MWVVFVTEKTRKDSMDRVTKRKSMPETYDFKIGEKCICWISYPYIVEIRSIKSETKRHWVLDNNVKFCKRGLNRSRFVGYSDTFIEPITEDSLRFVCTVQMVDAIKRASYHKFDYAFTRAMYEALINNTWEPRLPSVVLLDEILEDE